MPHFQDVISSTILPLGAGSFIGEHFYSKKKKILHPEHRLALGQTAEDIHQLVFLIPGMWLLVAALFFVFITTKK